jgi:hypothetical protein
MPRCIPPSLPTSSPCSIQRLGAGSIDHCHPGWPTCTPAKGQGASKTRPATLPSSAAGAFRCKLASPLCGLGCGCGCSASPHLCTNNVKPPHVPLYSNRHEVKDGDQCLQCLQALQASQEHLQHNKTDSRLAAQELRRPSRGRRLPPVYQAGVSAKLCHRSCASSSSPGC